jgi:hypothetical protein
LVCAMGATDGTEGEGPLFRNERNPWRGARFP